VTPAAGTPSPATTTPTARLRPPANRVSPRAIALWLIEYALGWCVVVMVVWGVSSWIGEARWSALPGPLLDRIDWVPRVVTGLGVLGSVAVPLWRYSVHRWEVGHDVLYTRTGWFTRHWLLIPVGRVQTVDAEQGWIERLLGLATLKVSTASHVGSSRLRGLPATTAVLLAADLARRADARSDDDAT
jgi:membrane protein YdbS with pleckstrin-like domain